MFTPTLPETFCNELLRLALLVTGVLKPTIAGMKPDTVPFRSTSPFSLKANAPPSWFRSLAPWAWLSTSMWPVLLPPGWVWPSQVSR